jgi:hypothetical protein
MADVIEGILFNARAEKRKRLVPSTIPGYVNPTFHVVQASHTHRPGTVFEATSQNGKISDRPDMCLLARTTLPTIAYRH